MLEENEPGQGIIGEEALDFIRKSRQSLSKHNPDIRLSILADITTGNVVSLTKAGADEFIVGHAFFHSEEDYYTTLVKMRRAITAAISC